MRSIKTVFFLSVYIASTIGQPEGQRTVIVQQKCVCVCVFMFFVFVFVFVPKCLFVWQQVCMFECLYLCKPHVAKALHGALLMAYNRVRNWFLLPVFFVLFVLFFLIFVL